RRPDRAALVVLHAMEARTDAAHGAGSTSCTGTRDRLCHWLHIQLSIARSHRRAAFRLAHRCAVRRSSGNPSVRHTTASMKLSAIVITRDNERTIGRCIESLTWA